MSVFLRRHSGESRNPARPLMRPEAPLLDSGFRRNDGTLPIFAEEQL